MEDDPMEMLSRIAEQLRSGEIGLDEHQEIAQRCWRKIVGESFQEVA